MSRRLLPSQCRAANDTLASRCVSQFVFTASHVFRRRILSQFTGSNSRFLVNVAYFSAVKPTCRFRRSHVTAIYRAKRADDARYSAAPDRFCSRRHAQMIMGACYYDFQSHAGVSTVLTRSKSRKVHFASLEAAWRFRRCKCIFIRRLFISRKNIPHEVLPVKCC